MILRQSTIVLVAVMLGAIPLNGTNDLSRPSSIVQLFDAVGKTDTSEFGLDVAGVGDQNHDGFADILVSARGERNMYLYLGGSPMSTTPAMVFRDTRYMAIADVNGDGFKDFIVGAFSGDYSKFHTKLYFGGNLLDTIPDLEFYSSDTADGFGHPYAIGDFNGDGYEDFAISAVAYPNGQYEGKVRVYFGGARIDTIPSWSAHGDTLWSYFGEGISGGDLNGDGYADLVVGGFQTVPTPFAYVRVYFGSAQPDKAPGLVIHGFETAYVVGDVDGDGYQDLLLLKTCSCDTIGLIYYGGAPMDTLPDVALHTSSSSGSSPSWKVSAAGDINRDGYDDIIVGNRQGFGGFGEVLVFLGGPHMSGQFAFGFTGLGNPYDGAGIAVGKPGDVNGDGIDDILFGAWNHDPGGNNFPGRAEIFSGDSTITAITDGDLKPLPSTFRLFQNFPNPFNPETSIRFTIPSVASHSLLVHVSLAVYDIQGRLIRDLLQSKELVSGEHQVSWNGKTDSGRSVSSGVYLYRIQAGTFVQTRKLLLLK